MKPEDIQNALGHIGDDLIEDANRPIAKRKPFKLKWIPIIAASLAIVILLGSVLLPGKDPILNVLTKIPAIFSNPSPFLLASPTYPVCAIYPATYSDTPKYRAMLDEWMNERIARRNLFKNANIDIDSFFISTMQEMLTDTKGANSVYSPINVYLSLALIAEISDGQSRKQILDLLGIKDIESMRQTASALWKSHYKKDGVSILTLANSIWLDKDFSPNKDVLKNLTDFYYASAFSGDMQNAAYQQAISGWINEQTDGILKDDLTAMEIPPETLMLSASTIHFCAKWVEEFSKSKTEIKTFYADRQNVSCEFMNTETRTGYYEGKSFSAICYGLKEQGGMWLVLPNKKTDINTLLQSEEFETFIKDPEQWEGREAAIVQLSLPKFNVGCSTDLMECLKSLGVQDIFDMNKADFSPLFDSPSCIGKMDHTVRCMIDEEGCSGAALTTVQYYGAIETPRIVEFTLDRPFYFQVTSEFGTPIFAGVVNNPTLD